MTDGSDQRLLYKLVAALSAELCSFAGDLCAALVAESDLGLVSLNGSRCGRCRSGLGCFRRLYGNRSDSLRSLGRLRCLHRLNSCECRCRLRRFYRLGCLNGFSRSRRCSLWSLCRLNRCNCLLYTSPSPRD